MEFNCIQNVSSFVLKTTDVVDPSLQADVKYAVWVCGEAFHVKEVSLKNFNQLTNVDSGRFSLLPDEILYDQRDCVIIEKLEIVCKIQFKVVGPFYICPKKQEIFDGMIKMLLKKSSFDITLIANEQKVEAHKVVLSGKITVRWNLV